jgi:hypothetical protein
MLKDVALASISGHGIISGVFLCFSTTRAFYNRQTSVLKDVVGKGQSVSREKEVKRYKN